jgi:cytochrome c553
VLVNLNGKPFSARAGAFFPAKFHPILVDRFVRFLALLSGFFGLGATALAGDLPTWAYAVNPPETASPPSDGDPIHVPDSGATFSRVQLNTIEGPVSDWHPDEHPAMPAIVARGRPPQAFACGYCHLPNGAGRPENASLSGLTAAYIRDQVKAFRNGERPGLEPRRSPQSAMIAIAKALSDPETDEAAAYFASVKPSSFIRVVETSTVPVTTVAGWTLVRAPRGGKEPIGNRIVEMAVDFRRFENRDSRTRYVAFAPPGSISRGADLAATGARGRSVACATCHGRGLKGMADVPRLAGRSPSYLVRQLHDLRSGKRRGGSAELMKPIVANLSDEEIVALGAYLASCDP